MSDQIRATNEETIKQWVEDASAGYLTAEFDKTPYSNASIRRSDGEFLDGKDCGDWDTLIGVSFSFSYPWHRKLDRRFKVVAREVHDAVRRVLVGYCANEPIDSYSTLSNFGRKFGL